MALPTAGMTLTVAVPAAMIILHGSRIADQLTGQQRQHCLVGITGNAAVQPHTGPGQGALGTAADVSADDSIYAIALQKAHNCAVAAACRWQDFRLQNHAAFDRVKLKLRCMAKMRKDTAVLIRDCNFHAGFLTFP